MKHKDLIKKMAKKIPNKYKEEMYFQRPSVMEEHEKELRKRCNCSGWS